MLGLPSRPRAATRRPNVRRLSWISPLLVAVIMAVSYGAGSAAATPSSTGAGPTVALPSGDIPDVAVLAGDLPSLVGMTVTGPLSPTTIVPGGLSFQSVNLAGQESLLASLYTPGSPEYHHFLQGDQFDEQFAPSATTEAELSAYLEEHGLDLYKTGPYLWTMQGTAAQMGAAFGTTFVQATLNGHSGYAPDSPLMLPAAFQGFATVDGGFQTLVLPQPANLIRAPTYLPEDVSKAPAAKPHGSLTINLSSPYIIQYFNGNAGIAFPPTNLNETWTLSITGGTAPYSVVWDWGAGSEQTFSTTAASLTNYHSYFEPGQVDYCYSTVCGNVTVWVNDSGGNHQTYTIELVPGVSPLTDDLYYDVSPLYRLGFSGQGTEIGLDEECDSGYPTADYTTDLQAFSTAMGIAQPKISLVGSGASSCPVDTGWSGETLLDMESAHAIAPNATLVVDLSDSATDEGDCTWDTGTSGVYVASNSWTGGGTESCWTSAASHGESYQTSSGDCGAFTKGSTDHPSDFPTDVSVGGTDVYPQASGIFLREFAWNGTFQSSCSNNEGSTGGYSSVAAPAFQTGMTGFSGTDRGVPDVAAIGGTWFWMVYEGGVTVSAGTSLACPTTTAMIDLLWQYNSTVAGGQGMSDYGFYDIAKGVNYDTAFHDIVVGNNIHGTAPPGSGYTTTVGWDPVTGLGSEDVGKLAEFLADIRSNPSPWSAVTAVLAANQTFGPVGMNVDFGADVTGGGSNLTGYTYNWNFGDGTSAWTPVAWTTHTYTTVGIYWPTVTVYWGTASGVSNGIMVHVVGSIGGGGGPLTASITGSPTSGTAPLAVAFSSTVSGGTPAYSYAWTFGDGSPVGTTANPSHTYASPGSYSASLVVTDSASNTATSNTVTVVVSAPGPLTVSASASPTSGTEPLAVSFTSSVSGGYPAYTYAWTFGDGSPAGTTANPSHTYTTPGTYSASVAVTDSKGTVASSNTVTITVNPAPLTVSASASSAGGQAPITIDFTSTVSGGVPAYTYAWTFGDGGTSTVADPSHDYTAAGTYSASVAVTDSASDHSTSNTIVITITTAPGPLAISISGSPTSGTAPLSVQFTGSPSGGTPGYSYAWWFGYGGTSTALSPTYIFENAGTYTVWANVTDSASDHAQSNVVTITATAPSGPGPLAVSLKDNATHGTAGSPVTFTATVTGGTPGFTYTWSGLPNGCSPLDTNVISCVPTTVGSNLVQVLVADSASPSAHATASVYYNVTAVPGSGGTGSNNANSIGGLSPLDLGLVLGLVVIAAVIVAVAVSRRRKKQEPPAMEYAPGPGAWPPPPPPG